MTPHPEAPGRAAPAVALAPARPEDAAAWMRLHALRSGDPPPPAGGAAAARQFAAVPAAVAQSRFLAWLGPVPVACYYLESLDGVMELSDVCIDPAHLESQGGALLAAIVAQARAQGPVLTAKYRPAYNPLFVAAGFQAHPRADMRLALSAYAPPAVDFPAGVTLRPPQPADLPALATLVYENYRGTPDGALLDTPQQAAVMVESIFGGRYGPFDGACSALAEDAQRQLLGDVLLGDMTRPGDSRLAWVLDLSIHPAWRGRGLGKALLVTALRAAQAHGYPEIGLTVTLDNTPALRLYESLGFQARGTPIYEAVLPRG